MTRQLVVMRHAKSAWPDGIADQDRPLAPRGERDAARVGRFLRAGDLQPDHVVVSPTRRTRDTARRVLDAAGWEMEVHLDGALYEGEAFQALREVPESARRVLLVGHEPELLELLEVLCGVDARVPTGTVALLEVEAPWPLQPAGRGVLQWMVIPKLLPDRW